ncbi:serine carboxypeptidase-like 32 [Cannabis sativa]|uniref:serine carboxypeptidase-like 32 n=1 Tax=Cannabis sativa TaxID=3483 RepID=UPI0029CA290C|nr:serine carboxypeptidase-like 32 [Cannabis sativa]
MMMMMINLVSKLVVLTLVLSTYYLQFVESVNLGFRDWKLWSRDHLHHEKLLENNINNNYEDDLVTKLPGQPQNYDDDNNNNNEYNNFRHYAGFITVHKIHGRALFYWFYEASSLPHQKPLVLWLNGGPGCSSVGYGATQEIGPFIVDTNGHSLKFNPASWNKEANMLFLESPIGVGFSYSNTTTDYENLGDEFTANDAYTFLHEWFLKFPSYKNHSFYIAGESYAGKYVPELAELIHDKNNKDPSLHINLKGILLGNPETSDAEDWKGLVDYAWSHAVISDETHKIIKEKCDFNSNKTWDNEDCTNGVDEVLKQYKEIDIYSLYTPLCIPHDHDHDSPSTTNNTTTSLYQIMTIKRSSTMMPRILGGYYDPCLDDYAKAFYNRLDVQKALHVTDGVHPRNWTICNHNIFSQWIDSKPSVLPIYKKLITAGLRIWVYSGDTDGRVPVLSTRYSLNSLGLPIIKTWRPWYYQNQVSGWYQEYEGITFATFRGAGHAVPCFKPNNSLALFTSFLKGQSLPSTRS